MLPAASLPADALVLLLDSPSSLSRAEALLPRDEEDDNRILAVGVDAEWGPTEDSEEEEEEDGGAEDEVRGGRRRRRGGGGGGGKVDAATLVQVAVRLRRPIPAPAAGYSVLATTKTTKNTRTLVLLFDLVALDHDAAAPLLRRLLAGGGGRAGAAKAEQPGAAEGAAEAAAAAAAANAAPVRLGWGLRGGD